MTLADQFRTSTFRPALENSAVLLTFATVVCLFTISSALLENFGYHYFVPGGFPWEKTHPATFVAVAALAARVLLSRSAGHTAGPVLADRAIFLYVVAIAITAAHAVLASATPVTQLIDTFLLPAILFCLLNDMGPETKATIALVVCGLMAFNALVGLVEYPTAWRLVPTYLPEINPYGLKSDGGPLLMTAVDWRGTALLGHPLINALTSGACALCLASRGAGWMRPGLRFPLIGLLMLSQAAFGGRASLVVALVGLGAIGAAGAGRFLATGRALPRRAVAGALLLAPIAVAAALVAYFSGAFDQVILRFENDNGSAQARIVMWQMFDVLSWSDILLGPDPEIIRLNQYLLGLELGIESFWVAMALTYGLIVAGILFCGIALFVAKLVRTQGRGAAGVLLYFFLVASTSTSLSSKSVTFALVTVMIMTVLRREPAGTRTATPDL